MKRDKETASSSVHDPFEAVLPLFRYRSLGPSSWNGRRGDGLIPVPSDWQNSGRMRAYQIGGTTANGLCRRTGGLGMGEVGWMLTRACQCPRWSRRSGLRRASSSAT